MGKTHTTLIAFLWCNNYTFSSLSCRALLYSVIDSSGLPHYEHAAAGEWWGVFFLMTVSCWRHRLQCIVIVRSFLRLLKIYMLAVRKLDLSRGGGPYSVSWCVRPWIKLKPEYPFKLWWWPVSQNGCTLEILIIACHSLFTGNVSFALFSCFPHVVQICF